MDGDVIISFVYSLHEYNIYMCIYIYTSCIYIYLFTYIKMHVDMYIYIYIFKSAQHLYMTNISKQQKANIAVE